MQHAFSGQLHVTLTGLTNLSFVNCAIFRGSLRVRLDRVPGMPPKVDPLGMDCYSENVIQSGCSSCYPTNSVKALKEDPWVGITIRVNLGFVRFHACAIKCCKKQR